MHATNTGWKCPKFHISANLKITLANFLTNHCLANMTFHEQLNISINKITNYFKITQLAHKAPCMRKWQKMAILRSIECLNKNLMKVVINKVNLLLVVNSWSLNVIKTKINNTAALSGSIDRNDKGVKQKRESGQSNNNIRWDKPCDLSHNMEPTNRYNALKVVL